MVALERPPRWGLIAIVVLLLANVGLILLVVQRQAAGESATAVSAATSEVPMEEGAAAPPADPTAPTPGAGLLVVYGDGYSAGNTEGGVGAAGWPALVSAELGMQLQLGAATLTGYVNVGSTGQTYPQLAQAQPAGAAVTVVFGSRNDAESVPGQVQAAAASTFAAIRAADPQTDLLVIGPCWTDANPPAALTAVSTAIRTATEAAGGTYVDPLTERWFADPDGLVSAEDQISVLDGGHRYLAGLIAPLIRSQLAG